MMKLDMDGSATFSHCRLYRYSLTRTWGMMRPSGQRRVAFCMLNPSTADEKVLDPTVRRCVGYAYEWGFDSLEVVNLFGLRSTDPKALYAHHSPVSGESPNGVGVPNDIAILQAAQRAEYVVAAWGNHGSHIGRSARVLEMLSGFDVRCLKMTGAGEPGHPLYLSKSLQPVPIQEMK